MKMNLLLYAFIAFLSSCGKSTDPVAPPVIPPVSGDTLTQQYGMPFANVPAPPDATIYQVNIRCFSADGNLQGVVKRLDSIKALGINVVYLMPVFPVGVLKAVNSPYCVKDYLSINPEFGNLADLRAVIDGAHSRNMAVILDWVANHTSWDNAWVTEHKDWYLQDANGNIVSPPGMGWKDVAQLNFTNAAMRLAMIHDMKYWVLAANVDGFRCDYADGPPIDFWQQAIDTLRNISTHKILMLAEGTRSTNFSAGFDYNFGFNFYDQLKGIFSNGQSVTLIDNLNTSDYIGTSADNRMVRYITNHDVNSSDGTPLELFGGESGSMAAFVIAAYMKSVPMIYNGQEVATPIQLTFPFTTTKIDWSINPDVTAAYKKVLAFRNSNDAVRRGALASYSTDDVCAFTKIVLQDTIFVISNLRNKTINYTLPSAFANSTWSDAMNSNTAVQFSGQVNLPAYTYMVLEKK